MDALELATRAHSALGDWPAVAQTCRQMRGYPVHSANIEFTEARAWTLAGRPAEALPALDAVLLTPGHSNVERTRAAFLGGALAWRLGDKSAAMARWQPLAGGRGFFPTLATILTGAQSPDAALATLPPNLEGRPAQYAAYAQALAAWMAGRHDEARAHLGKISRPGIAVFERDILELWAAEDLSRLTSAITQ